MEFKTVPDKDAYWGFSCILCDVVIPRLEKYLKYCNDDVCFDCNICRSCTKQLARFFDLHKTEILTL